MKIREHVFFEKYAYKVSLLVTFALFGVIILLSFVTFLSVRKSMLDTEYQHNRSILYQVKYNIDYMDDMVRDACLSLYTDNNTISIMYNKNAEFYDVYGRLLKLQQLVNTTPYLHSIYIYNNISKLYYTTDKGIGEKR